MSFGRQYSGNGEGLGWMRMSKDSTEDLSFFADMHPSVEYSTQEASPLQASGRKGSDCIGEEGGNLSFKELHAERNKQAQRRFRKRQKEKIEELTEKLASLKAQKLDMEDRQSRLEQACLMCDEELKKVRDKQKLENDQEEDDLARNFQGAVTLTFREEETITLSPSQIKQMSEQELAKFWSTYIKELAVLLVSVEGNPEPAPEIMTRIKELVQNELLFLYIRAALTNMNSVKKFVARAKIEEVRFTSGPVNATNRWNQVSQALNLTGDQMNKITTMWRKFVESVSRIAEDRQSIHSKLQECSHNGESSQNSAKLYLEAQEQMEVLKRSLRAEHVQIHEFLVAFLLEGLEIIQMARCFVRSFPFYPDIPAIAAWVAVSNNDPIAHSKLSSLESKNPAMSS